VIDELLQGVYNNGEVIWLETVWSLRRLFGSYIYTHCYGSHMFFDGWVEIMPKHNMLRFCDYNGSVTWKYNAEVELCRKGWKGSITQKPGDDTMNAIRLANEAIFHEELEKELKDGL